MTVEIEEIKQKAISDFELKKYPEAIDGFERCIEYFNEIGDELSNAEMRNNLSVVLLKTRDYEKAYQIIVRYRPDLCQTWRQETPGDGISEYCCSFGIPP